MRATKLQLLCLTLGAAWACSEPAGPGVPSFVDCAVFPESQSAAFVLPFAVGQEFAVSRTFGHYTTRNGGVGLYAVDFPMPIGTPVHAARGGAVIAVEERYADDDHADFHENWVMIRHPDNTVARYIHLTANGSTVGVGDTVMQGQLVGLSGNSGASTGPHLHFDVQMCGPNLPPAYNLLPCGTTVPVSFRNTSPHVCGLVPGESYQALAFIPALARQ